MSTPLISVIIPVYNTETYLPRCLDSIICNDYNNLEIICINDGSTDNSIGVLKEYRRKDDRIIIIDVDNGGVSRARNIGLKNANGEYICFIDSDDWIHKQFFDSLIYFMGMNNADIVICNYNRISSFQEDKPVTKEKLPFSVYNNLNCLDNHTIKSYIFGRLYKSQILSGISFSEEVKISEDTLFNTLIISKNPQLVSVLIDTQLYYYYNRPDSAINTSKGLDFKVLSYIYLDYAEKSDDKYFCGAFLNEAFKNTFSVRYATMFESNMAIKNEVNQLTKRCLSLEKEKKPFPRKKAILLKLFAYFPNLYRWFRIMNDPTMLAWEKSKKKDLKRQK